MPEKDSISLGHTLPSDVTGRVAAGEAAVSVEIGQRVGSYRVVSVLGRGGMGVVFRGVHEQLSRQAAIKVLRADLSQDPAMVSRFFNEAEAVNVINHPGIVSIFEFGQLPDQTLYIVMEHLSGETLYQRQSREKLGVAALRLYRQIASALQAAHARGIVHRDLKPENVFIVEDPEVLGGERTKLLDFGIAKVARAVQPELSETLSGAEGAGSAEAAAATGSARATGPSGANGDHGARQTRAGLLLGTPVYMSPEQCTNAASVDAKSDVYSLGVMLYEALSGQPPFLAREPTQVLTMHLYSPPPPLRERAPQAPESIVRLVERMLAKAPADRPDMAEVSAALEAVIAELDRPAPAPTPPPAPRWPLRAALAAGLALALGGGAFAYLRLRAPREQAGPADPAALRSRAIAVLREGLGDADPALRRRSVVLLALGRDGRLSALLSPLLADPDPALAALAAEALGQLGARDAAAALRGQLDGARPPALRVAAAGALLQLGGDGAQPALAALREAAAEGQGDDEARRRALVILAERGDGGARDRLVGQKLRGEEQVALLGRLARAGEGRAREQLAQALGPAGGAVDERVLRVAEELLRSGDGRGRPALAETAARPGPLQLRAAWILAGLGEATAQQQALFSAALDDSARPLRERILGAEGLGLCGGGGALPRLGRALGPAAQQPLLLRLAAAGAVLRLLGSDLDLLSQDSLAWAEQALGEADWTLRREAAEVLGFAEGNRPLALLGKALKDSRAEVRERAAWALGRGRERAALPLLEGALADASPAVREEAMRAIGRIGERLRRRGEALDDVLSRLGGKALSGDEGERVAGASMLIGLGDVARGVQALLSALRSAVFAVRFRAAVQLAEQRRSEGAAVLREALQHGGGEAQAARRLLVRLGLVEPPPAPLRRDDDVGTRQEVVALLPYLKPAEALALLRQAAADPEPAVRQRAVDALWAAEDLPGADAVLRTLLSDPDRIVRTEAAALLRRRGEARPAQKAPEGKAPEGATEGKAAAPPPAPEPPPAGEMAVPEAVSAKEPPPAPPAPADKARPPGKKGRPRAKAPGPSGDAGKGAGKLRPEDERRLKNNAIRLPKRAIHGKASVIE